MQRTYLNLNCCPGSFYSRALTAKEVQDIAECSNKAQEGDLVAWSSTVMIPKGNVLDMNIAKEEFCSVSKQISIFPERKLHDQALHWCDNLKATIALPRSQQENENLFAMSEPFLSVCQPPNHATLFLWVGATDKISNGEHRDYMGKLLNYSNFVGSSKSSSKSCVAMKIPPEEGGWDDVSCGKTYSFCVACEESIPTTLKMRGLCEDDFQALMFRLSPKYGQKTGFRGFTKYEIYFDEDTLTWTLWDMWTNVTAATYFAYDSSYPLGTHKWQLATDYYVCGKPKDSEHMLALSACYDWEYSCEDATCINLTQRCDMRVDCPDASDEKSCEKLSLPSDYLATLTPPGVEPGPLKMNLNISLIGFSEVYIIRI
ncbi:hypothetical protein SK128_018702 [Halocaridina rubra]|uniref:C-type lectin domain-containing protein n=1 Tax=Halocaridina rubra TaxID=373956 RepID=A0AAN8XQQ2_HALRR